MKTRGQSNHKDLASSERAGSKKGLGAWIRNLKPGAGACGVFISLGLRYPEMNHINTYTKLGII